MKINIWCGYSTSDTDDRSHWHFGTEFIFVTEGSMKAVIRDKSLTVESGHILMTQRFAPHFSVNISEEYSRYCLILQNEEIQRSPAITEMIRALESSCQNGYLVTDVSSDFELLKSIFNTIKNESTGNRQLAQEYIRSLLEQFLILLCRHQKELPVSQEDVVIMKVKAYIDKHFTEKDISVSMLAERHFVSLDTLIRRFYEVTGITPKQYIITKRLNFAQELLTAGKDSVLAVSDKCGFGDVNHFIRIFREKRAITPAQFKSVEKKKRLSQQTKG